jgi:hypothetical protein
VRFGKRGRGGVAARCEWVFPRAGESERMGVGEGCGRGLAGVRGMEARWGHYGWRDAPRWVYSTYTRVRAANIVWDHNVCVCGGGKRVCFVYKYA